VFLQDALVDMKMVKVLQEYLNDLDSTVEGTSKARMRMHWQIRDSWECTVEIVYNEHEGQAEFARYNRFSL